MGTLKLATRWEVKELNGERSIQLFDANDNPLDGHEAYWEGPFYCINKRLTSLQGAPSSVGTWFNCSYNELTSLQGAPSVVFEWFNCRYNNLTSLQGGPSSVGAWFDCSYNQLTSLQGGPSAVGGYFICRNNQLTSLQGAPIENDPNINEKLLEDFLDEG